MIRTLLPVLALLLAAAPAAAQDVGVAAAVNQSAQSQKPNAVVRTIGLGDNVVHNERIDTNSVGLVQLLLADGTTFTVGPNSSLVIDSFVYDPAAGTAQVAATLTKGVLRFIGAATSKTPDGVAITTPVGVVGIRGGVTDINMSPPAGTPPHIDMIFGNSVTLTSGGELIGRLFEAGYSLAFTGGGINTVKTPPEWSSQIQQALSSQPGQTGGAPNSPTNATVANSAIDDVNSSQTPPEPPIPMPPLDRPDELGDGLIADLPDMPTEEHQTPGPPTAGTGYASGMLVLSDPSIAPGNLISLSFPGVPFVNIAFDASGDPVSGDLTLVMINNCNFGCGIQVKIDPAGSTLSVIDPNFGTVVSVPAVADLKDHTDVTLPAGVTYCQCDFLKWGFYSAHATVTDPSSGQSQDVAIDNGTWAVANDFTSLDELDELAGTLANTTATFNGHAVGTYLDQSAGIGPTLGASDMTLDWSFGSRTGRIDIDDFGGHTIAGDIFGDPSVPGFFGNVDDGGSADGFAKGDFVNDGTNLAAGVLGDFFVYDGGGFQATGTFMGER